MWCFRSLGQEHAKHLSICAYCKLLHRLGFAGAAFSLPVLFCDFAADNCVR
jgi:hypothetical protein